MITAFGTVFLLRKKKNTVQSLEDLEEKGLSIPDGGISAYERLEREERLLILRETLKMSNAEDLNRLTACSLVLLGHIFYVLGNHRVSVRGQAEGHRARVVLSGVEVGT